MPLGPRPLYQGAAGWGQLPGRLRHLRTRTLDTTYGGRCRLHAHFPPHGRYAPFSKDALYDCHFGDNINVLRPLFLLFLKTHFLIVALVTSPLRVYESTSLRIHVRPCRRRNPSLPTDAEPLPSTRNRTDAATTEDGLRSVTRRLGVLAMDSVSPERYWQYRSTNV